MAMHSLRDGLGDEWRQLRARRVVESGSGEHTMARKDSTPKCPQCNDAGYTRANVPFGHPNFGKAIPCSCRVAQVKEKRQQELVSESGILGMKRYKDASFDTFDRFAPGVRDAYRQAYEFADKLIGWLVLTGGNGCGKTHLAVAIAKKRIEAGDTVMTQTMPDLLDQLRAAFDPHNKGEESYISRFQEMQAVDLLILDDYGAESSTSWVTMKIFQLLNYRYNRDLPTVITTNNVDLVGIDPRIRSRLSDRQMVRLVKMSKAQDYRPRIQEDSEEAEEMEEMEEEDE